MLEFIAHVNSEDYDALPQDFVNLGATPADKLEKVRDSGITDGMAFALRQLNKGGTSPTNQPTNRSINDPSNQPTN